MEKREPKKLSSCRWMLIYDDGSYQRVWEDKRTGCLIVSNWHYDNHSGGYESKMFNPNIEIKKKK